MSEIYEQPSPGDVRYYNVTGRIMRQSNGIDIIHNELEGIGIGVFDAESVTARRGSGRVDGPLGAEMVFLRPLEEYETERLRRLGASFIEIDPELSDLHAEYVHQKEEQIDMDWVRSLDTSVAQIEPEPINLDEDHLQQAA